MKLSLLILATCIAHALGQQVSTATKEPPRDNPSQSQLSGSLRKGQKGTVVGDFGGLKGAKSPGGRSPNSAEINKDGNGKIVGKTHGGSQFGIQRNRDADGKPTNSVAGAFDGKTGARALNGVLHKNAGAEVNADTKNGNKNSELQWQQQANGELDANVEAQGKTGHAHGYGKDGKDRFDYKTARGGQFDIDPETQTKTSGNGDLKVNSANGKGNGDYKYTIKQDGRQESSASLKDANPSAGRSGFDWVCTGQKVGSQVCKNARGETKGRTQCDDQGNCRVFDSKDRVVGRGQTEKRGDKHYVVNINRQEDKRDTTGLYLAEVSNYEDYDCYKEITRKNDPNKNDVVIKKGFKFAYDKNKSGNTTTIKFPACFVMTGTITLARGISIKDVALEFQARINPLGDYKCQSAPTCGRECYFCNPCDDASLRWEYFNANTDNSKVCSAVGGNDYEISMTVCPPPDGEMPVCGKFERSFSSTYWGNQDTIITRMLVWKRPADQTEIEYNFFYRLDKEGASFKSQVQTTAQTKGLLGGKGLGSATFTDFELLNAYVRNQLSLLQKDLNEELLHCQGTKADYNLAGSKVSGKFLAAAADTLVEKGNVESNLYGKPLCKEVANQQQDEFNRLKQNWENAGKPQGKASLTANIGGGLGGIFGG